MVESVDQGIGKILEAIDRLGLPNSTIMIFTNEKGGKWVSYGGALFNHKWAEWEGGTRVPALVKWPGIFNPGVFPIRLGSQWT